MDSLLPFLQALSSPTTCRFSPALSGLPAIREQFFVKESRHLAMVRRNSGAEQFIDVALAISDVHNALRFSQQKP
jgi:hypothetical protein